MNELKVNPKHPNLLSSGTMSGDKVINPRGEDLGKIEDDKDNWPDMANPDWGESVHKFYGHEYITVEEKD